MDPTEADARFGATALRALEDAVSLAAREPRVALTQARKAVEALALHLYAREIGDPDAAPKRLMLDDLLKALVKQKLLPEGVSMHFGTVQRYGNYGSHPQADDASVGNTVAFNQPCIESLRFIARWYVKDRLRLSEPEVPTALREVVFRGGAAPSNTEPRSASGQVVSSATPSSTDRFGLVGASLEGKYQIEVMVAEGGFGSVYRGVHQTLEKPIALKVLKAPSDATEAAREAFARDFALEAKTIARMEHPAIVKVLDFGVSTMPTGERLPWMVLDWVQGESLGADLKRRRNTPGRTPAACMEIMRPILHAMAYAHEQGIAHRDIKPANIMLPASQAPSVAQSAAPEARQRTTSSIVGRRGDVSAKILDFGIAKIMAPNEREASGETVTQSAAPAFSLPYAAPEQVSGTRTGPWTDVHALALVLVEMLVNRRPYTGSDAQELYTAALSVTRPTPARLGLDVGAWEPVIARALAARPADRFASAGDFLDALEVEIPKSVKALDAVVVAQGGVVNEQTLRGAEVPARVGASSRTIALAGAGVAIAGLLSVGAVAIWHSTSSPEAPSHGGHTAVVAASASHATEVPHAAPSLAAPSLAAPSLAAPSPAAPSLAVVDAGATVAASSGDDTTDAPRAHEHHGGHHRHGHRDHGAPEVLAMPVVAAPERIHAD